MNELLKLLENDARLTPEALALMLGVHRDNKN